MYENGGMLMKVGDKRTEKVESIGKTMTGRVTYIHPLRRYYVVEFKFPKGSFRESFYFEIES